MPRLRIWRNALLTLILIGAALTVWENRFEPAASPYFHRNRLTGAVCHRGAECWMPRAPLIELDKSIASRAPREDAPATSR